MNRKKLFIKNALILSSVSIVMRGIAVSFNAYVNNKIGPESMGLFTLVMSIYSFALTLALSCVNLASVRLTSEKSALLDGADTASWRAGMRGVVVSCVKYSLIFSVSTGVIVFVSADFIANHLLNDARTVISLKVLSLTLPAISVSSAISGYFTGLRKVSKNAVIAFSEQFMKIVVTSTALVLISPGNVESACVSVVGGAAVSEAFSLLLNIIMYLFDSKIPVGAKQGRKRMILATKLSDATSISLPSALGTYARQGLTTLEHLAIPKGLRKSGLTNAQALSTYGLLQGISLPLVMFPYAVIGSFTSLLIPEIAERNKLGDKSGIQSLTSRVYYYSAIFSVCACGVFVNYASELGMLVYNSDEATVYTVLLGLLVPFMYLDTAVDSLLKGIGEQLYIMKVNIADSASGLILVMLLTPRFGIMGYIITIWICEIGNLFASIIRLAKVTGVSVKEVVKYYLKPVIVILFLTFIKQILLNSINSAPSIIIFVTLYLVIFSIRKEKRLAFSKSYMIRGGIEPPFTP